jgi:single-strand DNA-binding protein
MAHIYLTGNVASDPEAKTFTQDGEQRIVVNFSLADHKRRRGPGGDWETVSTTFYRVTAWQRLGELAASLAKGSLVHIHGEMFESAFPRKPTDANPAAQGHQLEITAAEIFAAL